MEQKLKKAASRGSIFGEIPGSNQTVTQESNSRSQSLPARFSKSAVLMTLSHGDWDHRPD